MNEHYHWWQTGIIYQIYPRSFQDSNGDGVGDLPGILQRMPYLQRLGIEAIWLSPIYPSPMADHGYDIADYCGIAPIFGTMEDFDRLLAAAHAAGLKLMLDLVPNHSSDQHPWFLESRASRDNPKRDWYIWRDPAPDGGPPNNWRSFFGGSAWELDPATGQYYLHLFHRGQPDLNYRNPTVLEAMLDVMRFWLDKGVDGFRVDVIWLMMKDAEFRDEPPNPNWQPGMPEMQQLLHIYTGNLPEVHTIISAMRRVLDEYDERMMVGEIYLPLADLMRYYGENSEGVHLPFNFHLVLLQKWEARRVRSLVDEYESLLPVGAWPNWVLGNHDQHRVATRVGQSQARVAMMLLLALRGTPTVYNGDELGMLDGEVPPDKIQDPQALGQPEIAAKWGRDPERTPLQWDSSPNAGFTQPDVEPWLPVASNYLTLNAALQEADPTSMLHMTRAIAALRQAEPALHLGAYFSFDVGAETVFAFLRSHGDRRFVVVLNLAGEPAQVSLNVGADHGDIVVATGMQRSGRVDLKALDLAGDEGLIIRLDG